MRAAVKMRESAVSHISAAQSPAASASEAAELHRRLAALESAAAQAYEDLARLASGSDEMRRDA
jgi:hypothetical protein